MRRGLYLALAFVVCYGLLLTVATDSLYLLAVPGILGFVVVAFVATDSVQNRPVEPGDLPLAGSNLDHRAVVKRHYQTVYRRYAVLAATGVVCVVGALLIQVGYVAPFIGIGLLTFIVATRTWLDQLRWIRRSSRVLDVYHLEYRAPAWNFRTGTRGRLYLRLGSGEQVSPVLTVRCPVTPAGWPEALREGVWFAGDDVFGGAVVAPGSGALMCMQPRDWSAQADARARAGTERARKAASAGLDKLAM